MFSKLAEVTIVLSMGEFMGYHMFSKLAEVTSMSMGEFQI